MSSSFQFTIAPDHAALPGHFPGHPIVPGVLLLDRVITGIEAALVRRVRALQQVKFAAMLLPAETARVSFDTDSAMVRFGVTVQRDSATVMLATGSLRLADPPGTSAP